MHILILNWRDVTHPLAGGAEASLFEHSKYWIKNGARVTWFSSWFPGARYNEVIENVEIIRRGYQYTVHLHALLYYLMHLRTSTDIVIDNFHFVPFFTPLYVTRSKIIALINEPAKNAWFKNIFFPASLIGYLGEKYFFRFYYDISFITSAASILNELKEYGIKKSNIHVIPHGVSTKKINRGIVKKKYAIMYLAQLSEDKGIEDALEAFSLVKKSEEKVELWVVGRANSKLYNQKIKNLARKLHIAHAVTFYGYVSEEKKFNLLCKAYILIHPSIREGWGLNVIEANFFGTPAVGYNVTGLKDSIQDMKTGLITEENTPLNLAEKVTLLIKDKTLYSDLASNAVTWSKTFSWDKAGAKSWELINSIYNGKKHSRT